MFSKNLLAGILILTICSTSYHTSLNNQYFNYFDTGYTLGVLPLTWKYIPYGLKSASQNKIATCVGIVGFASAIGIYGLAIYGFKKLIIKEDKKIESKKLETSIKSSSSKTNSNNSSHQRNLPTNSDYQHT